MKCYRIKHVPTGLYYIPARQIQVTVPDSQIPGGKEYVKSNLSKKGKIYTQPPSFRWLGDKYYTHFINSASEIHSGSRGKLLPVDPSEWEIEEA